MKALITGAGGFVGRHLRENLLNNGHEVVGCDIKSSLESNVIATDILSETNICELIQKVQPNYIYHLAGQSNVAKSWEMPAKTMEINAIGALNLLNAVKNYSRQSRVLLVGSSEQYGIVGSADMPIGEDRPMAPCNPYAVSKAASEMYGAMYCRSFGLDVILVRAFNHIGVGQSRGFVVTDFASKLADIENGSVAPVLTVGNLDAVRDFTDVNDVVNGYRLLMEKASTGQAYNVGSGKGTSIREVLNIMLSNCTSEIDVQLDESKMRVSDMPVIICDNSKICRETGWKPSTPLRDSLKSVMNYWRTKSSLEM